MNHCSLFSSEESDPQMWLDRINEIMFSTNKCSNIGWPVECRWCVCVCMWGVNTCTMVVILYCQWRDIFFLLTGSERSRSTEYESRVTIHTGPVDNNYCKYIVYFLKSLSVVVEWHRLIYLFSSRWCCSLTHWLMPFCYSRLLLLT